MYKLKSGIAYITAAAVIVALWVYWISNRVSVSVIVPVYNSEKFLSRCLMLSCYCVSIVSAVSVLLSEICELSDQPE